MYDDHPYRAMDLLVDPDTQGRVQEAVFFTVANLLNPEVDLLFFDTNPPTSNATPKTTTATARSAATTAPRTTDPPQIVIGLAVTKEGIPVRCQC